MHPVALQPLFSAGGMLTESVSALMVLSPVLMLILDKAEAWRAVDVLMSRTFLQNAVRCRQGYVQFIHPALVGI